jgi:hypothetical protein
MLDLPIPPDDVGPLFDHAWRKLADAMDHCYEVLASRGFRRDTVAEFERDVARSARGFLGIAHAVRSLAEQYPDQITIPFRVRRDFESAVLVVRALVDRCGYTFLSQTDFEEQVKAKLDAHDRRTRIPLLQVAYARSLRNGAEEDTIVDALAEGARSLKLRPHDFPPKTTYASVCGEYERRFKEWRTALAVGHEFPTLTEEERIVLARASTTVRQHARPAPRAAAPSEPTTPTAGSARTPGSTRKRRRKGAARLLLISAIDLLSANGEWGKTDTEIIRLADISRNTFYRLIRVDDDVKAKVMDYRRQGLGRGPVRPSNL